MNPKSVLLAALLCLIFGAALLLLVAAYLSSTSIAQVWRGYYTVLVSDATPASDVQQRLRRAGLSALTIENSLVRFNDFSSEQTVPVGRLSERFDSLDPRYDSYMKALPSYFHAGFWNVYYVKVGGPPPLPLWILSRVLRGLRWKSADFNGRAALLCGLFAALVLLFVLSKEERSKVTSLVVACGVLPWLPSIASGSYAGTLGGLLMYLGWSALVGLGQPLLRYRLDYRVTDRDRFRPMAAIAASELFAFAIVCGVDERLLPLLIRGAGYLVLLAAGLAVYEVLQKQTRQHRLYFPFRIAAESRSANEPLRRSFRFSWIALVLLASPVMLAVNWSGGVEIPTPVVYPGAARNSWATLDAIWKAGNRRGLPDLADYVAHRAFQAGLPYGARYGFPTPDVHLYEAHFKREGVKIVGKPIVVDTYTHAWFEHILADAVGVARLIERQPGVVLPARRPLYEVGYPPAYLAVFWLAALVVFLSSTFLRRGTAIQAVDRLGSSVTRIPHIRSLRPARGPSTPRRHRTDAAARQRDLVPDAVEEPRR